MIHLLMYGLAGFGLFVLATVGAAGPTVPLGAALSALGISLFLAWLLE